LRRAHDTRGIDEAVPGLVQIVKSERFELRFPAALARTPDELHLDVRGYRRRVEAYRNGCAWVA
jgi:hypothetical protein